MLNEWLNHHSTLRLRLIFLTFFAAIIIPVALLAWHTYRQIQWENFHQYQSDAAEITQRIDQQLYQWIEQEEQRQFTDYRFLVVSGDPSARYQQPSPLSQFPVSSPIPGALGYFQVDNQGQFTTPLLPSNPATSSRYGISPSEQQQREDLQQSLYDILSANQLIEPQLADTLSEVAEQPAAVAKESDYFSSPRQKAKSSAQSFEALIQQSYDQEYDKEDSSVASSNTPALEEELMSADSMAQQAISNLSKQAAKKRAVRKEQNALLERRALAASPARSQDSQRESKQEGAPATIKIFESEVSPFEFSLLKSGHSILFRKVWREGKIYFQGVLIDTSEMLAAALEAQFSGSQLSTMSHLSVTHGKDTLQYLRSDDSPWSSRKIVRPREQKIASIALYESRLSPPLSQLKLNYKATHIPDSAASDIVDMIVMILVLVLIVGTYLMYRLALYQRSVNLQQQNFVSAVSHELKTPLTSIRMYGELLKEDWVNQQKKTEYYDFICSESERLSRLISNVLKLAKMSRNDIQVNLKPLSVQTLMHNIESRISSQVETAGFQLKQSYEPAALEQMVNIDEDGLIQVFINLIDNALKFSAKSDNKIIELHLSLSQKNLCFSVRDYGAGIAKNQMKKIFQLFYRSENELTRETVGTGIGLALVKQLLDAMDGTIQPYNHSPGAEFRITLPTHSASNEK
ncbi:sensor histidine kinase KdpD [Pleionea sp. CnH1-48]|uniref:sensor histidine kinase n=1 Tax=Pleionea sp. CnH1-48 TaxID=2954494 RepID=UPI002096DB87|nr:HAMP domain-containing sensor histidine kinase [Pleionea sp. CnH1-48]MCO7222814.1 HAMP domain-containing histidine kinase [Pleionea sp. CnH1-48]